MRRLGSIVLLGWSIIESTWSQDGENPLADPEELAGGEMHLGAIEPHHLPMIGPEGLMKLHKVIDLDGNGAFSFKEMLEYNERIESQASVRDLHLAQKADDFKDGKISLDEILKGDLEPEYTATGKQAWQTGNQGEHILRLRFRRADQDGDGYLNEAELPHFYSPAACELVLAEVVFAEKDQDADGRISKKEFFSDPASDYIVKDEDELMEEDHQTFTELDQDSSGDIDKSELQEWESGRFHTKAELGGLMVSADSNADGEVTVDELLIARDEINGTSAMFHLLAWHAHAEL